MFRIPRRDGAAAALVVCLLAVTVSGAFAVQTTPLAEVEGQIPWAAGYTANQHRVLEAEAKARLVNKALTGKADDTPAMGFYDAQFYDLVLNLDPVTQTLSGTTTLTAEVTVATLDAVDLHLQGNMAVSHVTAGGAATTFSRTGDVLTVDLDQTYSLGQTVTVAITYSGNPQSDYFGWNSYDGDPLIWTLSEPYGARYWWACKDLNTDKADSVALHVTVPDDLIVASNGSLEGTTVPGPGTLTYHWTERYPIATYLVSLAIHPYWVMTDTYNTLAGGTMPVHHYVLPSQLANAEAGFPVTIDMLEAFAQSFGEYPFVEEKYGHAHFPWGGGMEHQTLTSIYYGGYWEGLIAHELGHQWFGDLVTCADFHHIWLNEGFATWTEARWLEMSSGVAAYHAEMAAARYTGGGTIYVEDTSDVWGIFDSNLSYNKASWVPHMLRHMMGDDIFFPALETYLADYGFDSATTEEFRDLMEAESGLELDAFFQQWIYGEYYPQYLFGWQAEEVPGGTRVGLRVRQVQLNTGLFTMPLDVRITTGTGTETFVIQNDSAVQWYTFHVDGPVTNLELDPEDWVLGDKIPEGVTDAPVPANGGLQLLGAVPNPFNPATDIKYVLDREQDVSLAIYDMAGRRVARLVDGPRSVGEHKVRWNGCDAAGLPQASGTYFARLSAGGLQRVKSLVLVR